MSSKRTVSSHIYLAYILVLRISCQITGSKEIMDNFLNRKRKCPPTATNASGKGPSDNSRTCPPRPSLLPVVQREINRDEISYDLADRKKIRICRTQATG
jgi:hypothetical protein